MKIIETKNQKDIEELGSALTLEGLEENSFEEFMDWIRNHTPIKNEVIYLTKGVVMNEAYHLTGDNAYPNDLNIVSVKLEDLENPMALIMPRFTIGARWMDDIVNNNVERE